MALYGFLKSSVNVNSLTGADTELDTVFLAPLKVINKTVVFPSDTLNLKRKALGTNVQRWDLEAGLMPTETAHEAFLHTILYGYDTSFYVRMPQLYRRSGLNITPGIPIATFAGYSADDDTIKVTGAGFGGLTLPLGEFIRFENHAKVYTVIESSINAGDNLIKIHPKLITAVPITTNVFYDARVALRAKYDSDTELGVSYQDGILSEIRAVRIIEAL